MNLEERFKAAFIPPRLQLRWLVARERARGERELALVPRLARRDRVSLDIGANRGVWSEVMRRHSAAVHAFEPNPKMFRELARAAGPGVTVHRIALSDRSGTAELLVPRGTRGYSNQGASLSAGKIGAAEHRAVTVEARRLDDLDLGEIGFIKIDVEGHELAVIEGARETLRRCRPNLIVEIQEVHAGRPIGEALAAVCAHGYAAFALDGGELRPVAEIDLPARHGPGIPRDRYLFNWVFLPA
ncbi:FkbM family methyltransferase [Neoroseomonas soli]|uniref:FkbM family methyltransferase n=1 Tax=Neoroseomonas soli TaxID=1081025 RepID=A0A9X9WYX0_9PROT|nr:FkbM family methyltransferase [Neoroseomonas soli]MBR0672349.1 FkbM family methyltransferase [Neoroseomonas soli]